MQHKKWLSGATPELQGPLMATQSPHSIPPLPHLLLPKALYVKIKVTDQDLEMSSDPGRVGDKGVTIG